MSDFTHFLKRLVFTKTYCDFYPLTRKEEICATLNNCDLNVESKESNLLNTVLEYLKISLTDNELDKEIKKKEINVCHKKKKAKAYDENGNKMKVKVDKVRLGFKKDEEQYNAELKDLDKEQDKLEMLYIHIYENCITEEDLEVIDEIIYNHRLNIGFEIAIALFVFLVIAFLILRKYVS